MASGTTVGNRLDGLVLSPRRRLECGQRRCAAQKRPRGGYRKGSDSREASTDAARAAAWRREQRADGSGASRDYPLLQGSDYRFAKLDADVEPVQFRCSPGSLAVRPMTEERFAGLLSEARQVAAAREVGTEVPLISEGLETEGPPPAAGAANDQLQGLLWAQSAVVLATPVIVGLSSYTGYRLR